MNYHYQFVPIRYFINEVKPYLPNAWLDLKKNKVGYEINFTKEFYKLTLLREPQEILNDLKKIDIEISQLSQEIKK